ncbi:MAG: hypothetical protein AAFV80_19655, partial [Bacteroidota bacterium]
MDLKLNKPSKKKDTFPIRLPFRDYLAHYNRIVELPIEYEDLLRFETSIPLLDYEDKDTLWRTVFYAESHTEEIYKALTYIYALLKTDGDIEVLDHLTVARIDFCTFGNSNPFRVRIINSLNDNYDHFYVKRADASRVYGLELEDLLSPNKVTFLVDGDTLIEEHIAGIPGDDFMKKHLEETEFNEIRIAKEFVKFNERCFVRLLGDMRAYNYVVDVTPDIEGSQFRLRAIDFDQQSYEGRKNFYLPQFFKDNNPIIFLGIKHMSPETVRQYQYEERSLIANRIKVVQDRMDHFFRIMSMEPLSREDKIQQLKIELNDHHRTASFSQCSTMGHVVYNNIKLLMD